MNRIKQLVEQAFIKRLAEEDDNSSAAFNRQNHPEVKALRNKGYSVYVSKVHRDDPHVIHEIEKDGNEMLVMRHEGDGKYYLRTGAFGELGPEKYDSLEKAMNKGMELKKTGKYNHISTLY